MTYAQANSWISATRGFWDDYTKWSLDVAPSTNGQSFILITNAATKTVTIDAFTSGEFPDTMTINNLIVSAPTGSTNTLLVSGIGTNLPLTVLSSLSISNGGMLVISASAVNVSGPNNSVLSLGGDVVLEDGSLLVSNVAACGQDPGSPGSLTVANGTGSFSGTLCVGLNTNATGSVLLTGGQLALTDGPVAVGLYGAGQITVTNGSSLASDQPVIVGVGAASQGTVTVDGSAWVAAGHLVVGQDLGAAGSVRITGSQLDVTNTFLTLIGGAGAAQQVWSNAMVSVGPLEIGADPGSPCALTMAGGTNQMSGPFVVGVGAGATGMVWITDGQVVATNAPVYVGSYGFGMITLSNGTWLGRDMVVGSQTGSLGQVMQEGGTISISSQLLLGKWFQSTGEIYINNGYLNVTNTNGTASLLVGGPAYVLPPTTNCFRTCPVPTLAGKGVFTQNGGAVTVDRLLLTNGANSVYSFSAGTLQTKATSVIHVQNFMAFTEPGVFVISSTVTNPQTFVVGDAIQSATFRLLGGVHSFVNDLRIRTNAKLTGCGTINGNVTVEPGGSVVADCGGTLTFSGSVTNNGIIRVVNGTTVESYGPVVNYGTIEAINGNTNFHAGFINYGSVITSNSIPQILSIEVIDADVWISFTTENGLRYFFEDSPELASADWTPVIGFTGSGTIMTFIDPNAASLLSRFYRIRLVVPE